MLKRIRIRTTPCLVTLLSLAAFIALPTHAQAAAYKTAVILYGFSDFPQQPVTPQLVQDMTFTATGGDFSTGSVNSYFAEVTENQIAFQGHLDPNGDVFGWYTLARSIYHPADGRVYACPSPSEDSMETVPLFPEINAAAAADGFDANNYDFVIYASAEPSCRGSAKDDGVIVTRAVSRSDWTAYAHELGHQLDLEHANKAICQKDGSTVPWDGTCAIDEYGDGYSVMGWDSGTGHFSILDKVRLGVWKVGPDIAEANHSGTYSLAPVTAARSAGRRGLRVRTRTNALLPNGVPVFGPNHDSDIFYYLEYRVAEGFNTLTQNYAPEARGVYVRAGVALQHKQKPLLLDMDPTSDSFALQEGVWYRDTASRVSFRVAAGSQTDLGVNVEVLVDPTTDFNHDGLTDIAFHRPGGNWNTVPVAFARGDGHWDGENRSAPGWANADRAVAVAGHFDGDAFTDITIHRPGTSESAVRVLFGNADGSWDPVEASTPYWANQPDVVAIPGHFNDDGLTDIAFHRPGSNWGSVPVLLSNGDGTWQSANYYAPSWANQPGVVAIAGHFNQDGLTDIAFHRPGGTWNTVPVLLSRGNGSWDVRNYVAPTWANQPGVVAIAGQFNRDALTDIAFHRPGSTWRSVPLLLAGGDGNWQPRNYVAPSWANQMGAIAIAGHFDGDAITDLAFQNPGSRWRSIPVLLAGGNGSWAQRNYGAPSWINQLDVVAVAGHFDDDGLTDIAFQRPGAYWSTAPVAFASGGGMWGFSNFWAPNWMNQQGAVAIRVR
jgi:hypothetical protein